MEELKKNVVSAEYRTVLAEFVSTTCAVCGDAKRRNQSFCLPCYRALPRDMASVLWKRFGEGYTEAYTAAKAWLLKERGAA
jgi:hypothetical protein